MPRIRTRVRPGAKSPSAIDRDSGRYENRLLLILFLAFGSVFFDRQALPFLAPFISKENHLSNTEPGTLSEVLALTWALSGLVAGRLPDKLGDMGLLQGSSAGQAVEGERSPIRGTV
ncbi:hypothetical protein ACFYO2_07460 [Streptomyces sp. NPDC006602]|uniref:hypothetical protein n=1 Tax=Streptomyces sp. NPDC006602 TaxID=3364751 RepID=UPI0036CEF51E